MKRSLPVVLLAVAVLLLGGVALLGREATLVWLADKVQARMGNALALENVHGSLLRDVHVDRFHWQGDTTGVSGENVTLAWAPWWMLVGKLAFRHASADTLAIERRPNAAATSSPTGLPDHLHVPLRLKFDNTTAQTLIYTPAGGAPQTYHAVSVAADLGTRTWDLTLKQLQTRWGRLKGDLALGTDAPHTTKLVFSLSPEGHAPTVPPISVEATAQGTLEALDVSVKAKAQSSVAEGKAKVAPFAPQPVQSIDAVLHAFNPHHLGDRIPEGSLDGGLKADTGPDGILRGRLAIENRARGLLSDGRLPLASLGADVAAQPGRWSFDGLVLDFGDAGKLAGDASVGSDEAALKLATQALDLSRLHAALWPTHLVASIDTQGPVDQQHVKLTARDGRVAFALDATASPKNVQVARARAEATGGGNVEASGALGFDATRPFKLKAALANFDPSAYGKYAAAKLNGRFTADGALAPILQVHAQGSVSSSTLRGLAVTGTGTFASRGKSDPSIALNVKGSVGATQVEARGTIVDPSQLQALDLDFSIGGKSMAELYTATRLPFPETPAYRLTGTLGFHDRTWTLRGFKGAVGNSDLAGDFTVDMKRDRPFVRAVLTSERLDMRDLGGFVGANPSGGKTPAGDKTDVADAAGERVLPQSNYHVDKLNAADVDVQFTGRRIRNERLPLRRMTAHLVLDHGQVTLQPLNFKAAGGEIDARIKMDARRAPIRTVADIQARGLRVNQLVPGVKAVLESAGTLDARTRLAMTGNSVAGMLGSADGDFVVAMNGGAMSDLVLRLANLDVAHSVAILARGDRPIPIRCFVGDFAAEQGVLHPRTVVLDSEHTVVRGEGTINLRTEALGMRLVAEPKDGSLMALRGPIRIGGTLSKPAVRPELGNLAARAGAAVALGAIAPPLALIPLLERGKPQSVDCEPLILDASRFIQTGSPPPTVEASRNGRAARAASALPASAEP